jgi:hypothetical protein
MRLMVQQHFTASVDEKPSNHVKDQRFPYPCITRHRRTQGVWRQSCIHPRLGDRLRWVVSLKPWLFPLELIFPVPLNKKLDGPQSRSALSGEHKNTYICPEPNLTKSPILLLTEFRCTITPERPVVTTYITCFHNQQLCISYLCTS